MERSTERDQRLMQVVAAALKQPIAKRDSYLRTACRGDSVLLDEAAEVVRGEEKMGSFLLHPAIAFQESPRPFLPGQIIASRFEIIRELGEGGMGVVYEAFDRKLNRRIAIKAAKPGFQPRLSPEIRGALAVSHPNICRVNEIHTEHTNLGDVDFLTMELLDGETLSQHLNTRGKLPEQNAFEVASQLCAGLAEAHRCGVIHRDLKSGNVVLCRNENNQLRVVITDFGLAGDGSQTGDLGGTPRYIAPELWRGEKASRASDIYALGVILHEMIAGRTAPDRISTLSRSDADISTASRSDRLGATSRSTFRGMPHRWAKTIGRCLDPAAEKRPKSANEVLAQLRKPSVARISAVGACVLLLSGLLFRPVSAWINGDISPSPSVRLVVLPASGSDSTSVLWGGALHDASDRISHLKSGRRTVAVITPSKAHDMQVQSAEQALHILHATHALATSVRPDGQDIVLRGSLIELQTGSHVRDFSWRYSRETQGALAGALAGEVSTALNLRGSHTETLSPQATSFYDRGLYYLRLDVRNFDEAIQAFEKAAQLDPRSPLPLAGLVEAELDRFDDTEKPDHLTAAEHYLQAAESLDPDSVRVHLAAGMLNDARGQYAQAVDEYTRVTQIEPRNVYGFMRMAGSYDQQNMYDKAEANYLHAIALDPSFYDPHQFLGVYYFHHGQYQKAAEQFQKVIELAPGMYNAYANLGASLEKLGRYDDAEKALRSALAIKESPRALNNMGSLLVSEKKYAEALPFLTRAAQLTAIDYRVLLNLGDAKRHLGRNREALTAYRKGMDLALSELTESPGSGATRAFFAYFAARLGDARRAEDEVTQALRLSPGDNTVIHRAVLTYEALGLRPQALEVLANATPELLENLKTDPDLAEFCQDSRFTQLVAQLLKK